MQSSQPYETKTKSFAIHRLLKQAREKLAPTLGHDASTDSEQLCGIILEKSVSWIVTHHDVQLSEKQARNFFDLVEKRSQGYPLAYLRGSQEFYGLEFRVGPGVLIPRPDTEILVDNILQNCSEDTKMRIADIGTGSGCIGVSLLKHRPKWEVYAVDLSEKALEYAKENATRHSVINRFHLSSGNLLEPLKNQDLDLIVANLPYLTPGERAEEASIAHEPILALETADNGLAIYLELFKQIKKRKDQPCIVLEIDPRRKQALKNLIKLHLPEYKTRSLNDLAGHARVLVLQTD